ncbi:MAG TPA: hypothetical protein VIK18_12610 [Pirellulales bacterium]
MFARRFTGELLMPVRLAALLIAFACCSLASCRFSVITHDEQAAAKSAAKFADLAFVQSNYAGAEALLSPEMQQTLPLDKLAAEVAKVHPNARPAEVAAKEFEPLPGHRAMNIYLNGTHGEEMFFYRFLMVGDKGSGYKVGGMWRGSGPYPPSARRPLSARAAP